MAVVVLPEIDRELRESQSLLIEVRSDDGQLPSAVAALRQALLRLTGTGPDGQPEGVAFLPPPVPLPGAQLLLVDFGALPDEQVLAVPRLLAEQLRDGGVRDAVVSLAVPGRRTDRLQEFGMAARAYLAGPVGAPFGPAPPRPPLPLLDIAVDWLHATRSPAADVAAVVLGLEKPVPARSLRPVAEAVLTTPAGATVTVVASDFATELVAASVGAAYRNGLPAATLTVAPGQGDRAEVTRRMRQLRDLIRAHAELLVWAGVDAEPDTRLVLRHDWVPRADRGRSQTDVAALADVLVPDAMWHQLLSPGHLERVGGLPEGAVGLPGGRAELTIGEPEQWLPGHPDGAAVREHGRRILAPCLVGEAQAVAMAADRLRRFGAG
ncbi:hypothetical protein [Micromonospora purpureochromogenes]|uniref:Glucose-6-phosphate dehydrogenase assembly protein OpcA n=1 Tax=Micromonospora purpureochromogenes TaxID=47872 RepID=A0ABX2RPJ6_9ACTN|nr:hypothetical protein [Micromonospora purpureochromogenes]NYF57133.1 hypothetical protein [Micromonospora purpureochromogenes]